MALQPIIASPLSGTTQPDNYGAPANWVPGNGPPPGMTWSETQGRWMPSASVQGDVYGPAIPADNPLPVKFGAEQPMNTNPYGFTAPTGPAASVLVPYYNKATGQTWTAPSGGYTPPSADWFQGYPNSQISPGGVMPMPGFAPGKDPIMSDRMPSTYEEYLAKNPMMTTELKPWQQGQYAGMSPKAAYEAFVRSPEAQPTPIPGYSQPGGASGLSGLIDPTTGMTHDLPQRAPTNRIATEDPEFFRRAAEQMRLDNAVGSFTPPAAPTNRITTEAPPSQNLLNEIRSTSNQQPYMPIMTGAPQQQPTNNLNLSGLSGLFAFPKAPSNPTIKFGGLNALARPQTPMVNQPVVRNQPAPRAGFLPSLRIRPNVQRSLPVTFAKPTFRR